MDTTFDRIRGNRSFASLRTKLEQTGQNKRRNLNSSTYDPVDEINDNLNDFYAKSPSKLTQPWGNISSRQFSKDVDSENRSFVPYNNSYKNFDTQNPTQKSNNYNRTTISINHDPKPKENFNPRYIQQSQRHAFSIPLTGQKSLPVIKPKSNKSRENRSVNFGPSVECEVRLISPNYDIKPRRKESWKSKPANDWTFNKVHF